MGKSSPNSADVVGAATETGKQARLLNAEQTRANRPNQSNAWGQTQWSDSPVWNPVSGAYENQWTQTETLNPTLQGAVEGQQAIQAGRTDLAQGAMARAWEDYQDPMNFDQYGQPIGMQDVAGEDRFSFDPGGDQRQRAEDAAYGRATSRLDPQFQQRQQQMELNLRNKGLQPGDAAYDSAINNFNTGRNDAYEMARLGSVGEGRQEYGQQYQQALGGAQMRTGQQAQEFGQAAQQNQIANALRQQQIQEDIGKRGYNLTEAERLLQGQIIQGGPPTTGVQTETIASKALGGG